MLWRAERNIKDVARSVPLLVDSIEGYEVAAFEEPQVGESLIVRYGELWGMDGGVSVVLADVGEGDIAYHGGMVSREEFDRLPRREVGCGE